MKIIRGLRLRMDEARQTLAIPAGAKFLDAKYSGGAPHVYFEMDEDKKEVMRKFVFYETNQPVDPKHKYVGTVVNDPYVFHIYEDKSK